jgi:penicillin-binding protein 1A
MLLGRYEKTFDRKIKELLIAWKIENQYSKQQIFTLYCNQHYFGHGAYGVAAAADTYFGKTLGELTLGECAMIAGLPRSPGRYSPILHPDTARSRRNYILSRMVSEGMISPKMAAEAKEEPLLLTPRGRSAALAPYFVEMVRQSLAEEYSTDVIWRSGLRVYTTLDRQMQAAANRALRDGLRRYDKRHGWRGPIRNVLEDSAISLEDYSHPSWRSYIKAGDFAIGLVRGVHEREARIRIGDFGATLAPEEMKWTGAKSPDKILKRGDLVYLELLEVDEENKTAQVLLDQIPEANGAFVTIENATGAIKALVGGYDFETSQFNRATQAMRQPGSTFKPIVYSAALEKGLEPDSTIIDAPISYTDELGRLWEPPNYDGEYKGEISLLQALTESRNVPTIKIAALIGIHEVLKMARRFGLSGTLEPYLPLALGAGSATPLEMASTFTVFPNLGMQYEPHFISRIEDYEKAELESRGPRGKRVLQPDIADKMLRMLQNVIQEGTGRAARSLGRPLGGKTGTTDDYTDAWFVGFTPSMTSAVWIGFETRRTLGYKEEGAAVALPIWIQYQDQLLRDKPIEQFPTVEFTDSMLSDDSRTESPGKKKLFIESLPTPKPNPTKKPPLD